MYSHPNLASLIIFYLAWKRRSEKLLLAVIEASAFDEVTAQFFSQSLDLSKSLLLDAEVNYNLNSLITLEMRLTNIAYSFHVQ